MTTMTTMMPMTAMTTMTTMTTMTRMTRMTTTTALVMLVASGSFLSRADGVGGGGGPAASARQGPRRDVITASGTDPTLREELLRMAAQDQAGIPDIRQKNQAALRQILDAGGWPLISMVELDGSRAAWLIAQHADDDIPLQKRCLELIQGALLKSEVETQALAYLTDRILK